MREIKFRGKSFDNGEWIYGDYHKRAGGVHCIIKMEPDENGKVVYVVHQVVPDTIGQFTGLHDKNGKKIYEGDILSENGYIWGVYFEVGAFFISKNGKHDPYDYGVERLNPYTASGSIVLTNIHDNPELLNE